MGCLHNKSITICGNFNKITKRKPKNWIDTGYKMMIKYSFKWREKIGKVECTCNEVLECYQPWYGCNWYHSDDCALMQQLKKRPQLMNLWCYNHLPQIPTINE